MFYFFIKRERLYAVLQVVRFLLQALSEGNLIIKPLHSPKNGKSVGLPVPVSLTGNKTVTQCTVDPRSGELCTGQLYELCGRCEGQIIRAILYIFALKFTKVFRSYYFYVHMLHMLLQVRQRQTV